MRTHIRNLVRHSRHGLAAFLIGLFACTQVARAEDIEIYTNPAANTLRPPYTVIVLDLNLLGICNSVVTQTSNPNNPDSPQLCLNITSSIILSDLLGGVTSNPATFLTNLLLGTGTTDAGRAQALCDLYGILGISSPVVNLPVVGFLLKPLLGGVSTLTCGTLSFLLGIPLLSSIINPLLSGFVGDLVSGLLSPLLSTAIGQLPSAVTGLLNTTFSGILNLGQVNLITLLESILSNLINTNVAIMVSHADRSNATGSPGSTCAFADTAGFSGPRRSTTGCSNGAYFLVGFTPLVNQGAVTSLLGTVNSLLTNALNPVNLLNSVTAILSTALTTPTQLLPPYQGKEAYAELVHYLAGNDIYNAPLNRWDGITGVIGRDTSVELGNGNYKKPALECRTANVLNVMLTNNIRDSESDTTLRTYFPGLPASGAITLGNVVQQAASPGFKDNAGNDINLRSFFLVQDLLTSTATLANTGATVLTYANSLGLLGLGQSFATLLKPVLNVDASLLTPSLTADLVTPSNVRQEAFFGGFKPDVNQKPRWPGNLKKLQVRKDSNGDFQYFDATNASAIGSDGRISTNALSFWTDTSKIGTATKDGRSTTLGGAGQKIPGFQFNGGGNPGRKNADAKRLLFYDREAATTRALSLGVLDADTASTAAVTELITDTGATAETAGTCGVAKTAAQVNQELLLYARGYDTGSSCAGSKGATTAVVGRDWIHGALLHSRPVAINYGARSGFSADNPDIRVVYGAADGFMRMVRNTDGSESWGFMPRAVMNQQRVLRNNTATPALPFGVDGAPAVLVQDRSPSGGPADGKIESSNANDRAWMFFGLRRGGRNYYAMNVTNPDAPSLMWRIGPDGLYSSGSFVASTAYAELGLAFSTPQIGRMKIDSGAIKPVLIFAGGYNGGRDAANLRVGKDLQRGSDGLVGQNDSSGNAIYIVDAETGDLIWKARQGSFSSAAPYNSTTKTFQHPLLLDSIAADATIIDSDGNGLIDRLYVLDTGGRLWRGDFPGSDRSLWTLTPLVSVGRRGSGTAGVLDDRRFFAAPDYAPTQNASGRFDAISFGSGDREDPLNRTTENYLYVYRDLRTASGRPASDVITSESSLKAQTDFADLTTTCAGGAVTCANSANLATGFRIKLAGSGEKVLSQPLSANKTAFFSSYVPPAGATLSCEPSEGVSKLYGISLSDSRPLFSRFSEDTDGDARSQLSATPGLPGEFNPLTATALAANAQTLTLPPLPPYTIYWRERRGDEERAP